MSDDRILILLKQKSVGCTLRKQPKDLTEWFYATLKIYSMLWVRTDRDLVPVKGYLNELYGMLKFVALPNTADRKRAIILDKWPLLRAKIESL